MTNKIKQARENLAEMYAVLNDSERWHKKFGGILVIIDALEKASEIEGLEEAVSCKGDGSFTERYGHTPHEAMKQAARLVVAAKKGGE